MAVMAVLRVLFLSTPSARRATSHHGRRRAGGEISIHALREEGDERAAGMGKACAISIHALREEGDDRSSIITLRLRNFYPRPPRGGRRCLCCVAISGALISIHALREEGDLVCG